MRCIRILLVILFLAHIVVPTIRSEAQHTSPFPPAPVGQRGYYRWSPYACAPYAPSSAVWQGL